MNELGGKAHTIQQTSINLGLGNEKPRSISYKVTEQGYYCVGAVSYTTLTLDTDNNTHLAGYAKFYNVFPGNLPATMHPSQSLSRHLVLLYIVMLSFWYYLCYTSQDETRSKYVQMIKSRVGSIFLVALSDALIQWIYLSYISYHDIDVERWRDIHGSGIRTFAARAALFLSLTSNVLRDVLTHLLTMMVVNWDRNSREELSIDNFIKGVYISYSAISFLFHLFIAHSLLGSKHLGRDIMLFPYIFAAATFNSFIIGSVEYSFKRSKEQHQKYKCKLLLYLGFLTGTTTVISLTTTLVFESRRLGMGGNGTDSSLSSIYAVASTWTYLWIGNGGAERVTQFVCKSPVFNDPDLALLMVIFRPSPHNIQGFLSDELAADVQTQDGADSVVMLDRDGHEADDTPDVSLITQPT